MPLITGHKPRRVLVADDDKTTCMFLEHQLLELGYEVTSVADGEEACSHLDHNPNCADVILLDKALPGMQGLDVVHALRGNSRLRQKPIVMLTGCDDPVEIKRAMDAGIFYYLHKPVDTAVLQSVIASAMRRCESNAALVDEMTSRRIGMSCVASAKFRFRSMDEALDVARLVSGAFPDPETAIVGISELLINAVEHGNLEVGFKRKTQLIEEGTWKDEIESRLQQPQYANRHVEVAVTKKNTGTYVVITDEGKGFNPGKYLNLDHNRSGMKNGRGIAISRLTSFDKLGYNGVGNQAVGFVSKERPIDW